MPYRLFVIGTLLSIHLLNVSDVRGQSQFQSEIEGRIDSYVFYYDTNNANGASSDLPPPLSNRAIQGFNEEWAKYLKRFPVLSEYSKPTAWSLESISLEKLNGWRINVEFQNKPMGFSPSGLPFKVNALFASDGTLILPHISLYDSFGPFRFDSDAEAYVESTFNDINQIESTVISEKEAIRLANDRLERLAKTEVLQKIAISSSNSNSQIGKMQFNAWKAEKLEVLANVYAWSVIAECRIENDESLLDREADAIVLFVVDKEHLSNLAVKSNGVDLTIKK